jgi:hypothetical protein
MASPQDFEALVSDEVEHTADRASVSAVAIWQNYLSMRRRPWLPWMESPLAVNTLSGA